jgi:hypothetical protein
MPSTPDWGKFTSRLNFTYIDSSRRNEVEVVGSNAGHNSCARTKGLWVEAGLGLSRVLARRSNVNYVHGSTRTALGASFFTRRTRASRTGTYPDKVRHHRTVDLFARYNINKNFSSGNASLLNAKTRPRRTIRLQRDQPVRLQPVRHPRPPVPPRREVHDVVVSGGAASPPSGSTR